MSEAEIRGWFAGRIPEGWFIEPPAVTLDREEILVVGKLPDVDLPKRASKEEVAAARAGGVSQHREDTREARMRTAAVAWCVRLVGRNEKEWINGLREALTRVEKVRDEGPSA